MCTVPVAAAVRAGCLELVNMARRLKIRVGSVLAAASIAIAVLVWSSDTITLQGQWTLYTAVCEHGDWQGRQCTGHLIAAERHHFQVDKSKREVTYEIDDPRSSQARSGRLSQCTIEGGRTWNCLVLAAGPVPVTRQLDRGEPVGSGVSLGASRLVSKRTWFLLRVGLPFGSAGR